jgi:hypothetical protein
VPYAPLRTGLLSKGDLAASGSVEAVFEDFVANSLPAEYAVSVAVAGGHLIGAFTGAYVVVAVVAFHVVVAGVAVDLIVAQAAVDGVCASVALDIVVTGVAGYGIAAPGISSHYFMIAPGSIVVINSGELPHDACKLLLPILGRATRISRTVLERLQARC